MSRTILDNGEIRASIESRGAELLSLKDGKTGIEYMWYGDEKYWGRCSPVLFPFVGNVRDKKYRAKGREYEIGQHGFARDMEFETEKQEKDNEVWFRLASDEHTMKLYPYSFILRIGYLLEGRKLKVMWQVTNPGEELLYFSIGGHPGFNCPIEEGEKQTGYSIRFEDKEKIICTRITENGLAGDGKKEYALDQGLLPVTETLFDQDALVIENDQVHEIALCRKDGSSYVTVSFDAPLVGVWTKAGGEAPFICIEPWYGRCDHESFSGTIEEREWGNTAAPGETWEASYFIKI